MAVHFVTDKKVAETSSKGNQEKWNENGQWYKLDQFGYEALAECLTSAILERSSIETDTPFSFVRYRMARMNVHGRDRVGCVSRNFLAPGESIITLSHLFKRTMDRPLREVLSGLSSDKKRIAYLAEKTAEITGLEQFPQYLSLLFEVDGLVLNDDRHLNNIAVLSRCGSFDYCPIFDNGAGFLSNLQTAPMDIEPAALIRSAKARPFQTTFNRQVSTVQALYGAQLHAPKLTRAELDELLLPLLEYYPQNLRYDIADRVRETFKRRCK